MGNKGSRMDGTVDSPDGAVISQPRQQHGNGPSPGPSTGGNGASPGTGPHPNGGPNRGSVAAPPPPPPIAQQQAGSQQPKIYASQQDKEAHESKQLEDTLGEFTSAHATPDVSAHESYSHWEAKGGSTGANGEDHIGGANKMNQKLHQTMHQTMRNTMCNGDLRSLVKLPANADFNEWLALNTIHFYRTCSLIGQNYRDLCTPDTCPLMSAGNVEYLWKDNHTYLKPTRVPACQYMEFALCEALACIEDSTVFPVDDAQQFSRTFYPKVKEIFKRLFRQFAHLYYSHYEQIKLDGSSKHLNSTFKHFIFFVVEFNLVDAGTMAPLQKFIDHIMSSGANNPNGTQRGSQHINNQQPPSQQPPSHPRGSDSSVQTTSS